MGFFHRRETEPEALKANFSSQPDEPMRTASRDKELVIPIIKVDALSRTFIIDAGNFMHASRPETKTVMSQVNCEDIEIDERRRRAKEGGRKWRRPRVDPVPKKRMRCTLAYTRKRPDGGKLKKMKKQEGRVKVSSAADADSSSGSSSESSA